MFLGGQSGDYSTTYVPRVNIGSIWQGSEPVNFLIYFVSLYCQAMTVPQPKLYLPLLLGQDIFVSIYHHRVKGAKLVRTPLRGAYQYSLFEKVFD